MNTLRITLLLMMLSLSTIKSFANVNDSTLVVPIIELINDDGEINPPKRTSDYSEVIGYYNNSTYNLFFTISGIDNITKVEIYLNGNIVICDNNPIIISNLLSYNLSVYGAGYYEVFIYAGSTTYIGSFEL